MFGSADPEHQAPPPFDPSVTWSDDLKDITPGHLCPYGRIHRAFVEFDLIKTDKGMVRLPKDGGPAFIEDGTTGNVDRHTVTDRVVEVSEEEAERMVRGRSPQKIANEALAKQIWPEAVDFSKVTKTPKVVPGFQCPICKKEFPTERQLKGHIGGAHKPAKKGKK